MPRITQLDRLLVPLAAVLVAASVAGAGLRVLLVVGLPVLAAAALAPRLSRGAAAALASLLGVLALGSALIAREPLLGASALLYLADGARLGWGLNRGRPRAQAWRRRALAALGAGVAAVWIVFPALQTVSYLAKPSEPVADAALGLPHESVSLTTADGVDLAGWYVPGRNGAAIVLVHGGGGDREGAVRHARMLAAGGYGVLLFDARGRGESGGNQNAFGWRWGRDVRAAVDFLERRGVERIGALGLSTGAEAVLAEAADDRRVRAVVGDGSQGHRAADVSALSPGVRVLLQPHAAIMEAAIYAVRGERPPPPVAELVRDVARTRPLLLVAGPAVEADWNRAHAEGTTAEVWELEGVAHTRGLAERPQEYTRRVLAVFDEALL